MCIIVFVNGEPCAAGANFCFHIGDETSKTDQLFFSGFQRLICTSLKSVGGGWGQGIVLPLLDFAMGRLPPPPIRRPCMDHYSSSVCRLQSADASLYLTGPGTPLESLWLGTSHHSGIDVYLQRMTDSMLAVLLPGLADRVNELSIYGE